MPPHEYGMIEVIRVGLAREGLICSKSEVVRAGLQALQAMQTPDMVRRLGSVAKVKPGRKL